MNYSQQKHYQLDPEKGRSQEIEFHFRSYSVGNEQQTSEKMSKWSSLQEKIKDRYNFLEKGKMIFE